MHELPGAPETSYGERGGERPAQWADRRDTQAAGGASQGGCLPELQRFNTFGLFKLQLTLTNFDTIIEGI